MPAIIDCYWNGNPISEARAIERLESSASNKGYERENWIDAWSSKGRSETSRDFLYEVSGYCLEIAVR